MLKRFKFIIKAFGSIMREVESRRPDKLSEIHNNFILKLIADSLFNTSNKIVLKLNNNFEVEVHRSTIYRFLVEKGYKWKGPLIAYSYKELDLQNKLKTCINNKERVWSDVQLQMKLLSILYHRENIDGLHQVIHTRNQKQYAPKKNHVWGAFSFKGIIKLHFFTANIDTIKFKQS